MQLYTILKHAENTFVFCRGGRLNCCYSLTKPTNPERGQPTETIDSRLFGLNVGAPTVGQPAQPVAQMGFSKAPSALWEKGAA